MKWFIYEGVNGVGKTTLINADKEKILAAGGDVVTIATTKDPSVQHFIQPALFDTLRPPLARLKLFCDAQNLLYHSKIKPALNEGKFVLCDRFWLTTYAYQAFFVESSSNAKKLLFSLLNSSILNHNVNIKVLSNNPEIIHSRILNRVWNTENHKYNEYHTKLDSTISVSYLSNLQDTYKNLANTLSTFENITLENLDFENHPKKLS